ncbi:DUF429 domain-containing protein [Haloarcula laminariae]|uniref:DUF429 domain-containing protein n=1 Tax=Haloarcula laminariae TaxID=2961577 RepID=UPI0021C917F1|nr:DUF429 domain-containing protein [Halomicroarcula laminariae]
MSSNSKAVVGVDACPAGWFATILDDDSISTAVFDEFENLCTTYDATRILVDIPIGYPTEARRRCDLAAREELGSRGNSVFFPPCQSALDCEDYEAANAKHRNQLGNGLSRQAYSIGDKIREVNRVVGQEYDSTIRESHPELCFAELNGQPIAYSKSSQRGQGLRMKLLSDALDTPRRHYNEACTDYYRKDVRRDDILDSMVLATAAQKELTTIPAKPASDEPRIYYPDFDVDIEEWEE